MPRFFKGTLSEDGGNYQNSSHAVNYLESHDDHTFGDFVRLALGELTDKQVITDLDEHAKLTPVELSINKLAAFILSTSQGIMMIHSGQEYARSKVIFGGGYSDDHAGQIDHNSYNKDDFTNYINYDHAELNKDLLKYYSELINMRLSLPELRKSERKYCQTVKSLDTEFAMGYRIIANDNFRDMYVLYNASPDKTALFELNETCHDVCADESKASTIPIKKGIFGQVTLSPRSGMLLIKH